MTQLAKLILRHRAPDYGLALDCGGWATSGQLCDALRFVGSMTPELTLWLEGIRSRHSDVFGSIQA
eukprot:11585805-Alexandrium_andersonii.AAC.1